MKLKKALIGSGILAGILTLFGIYKISTFRIFDDEIKVIEEFRPPNKDYTIRLYYVPSNATTQSYIQVRKIESNIEEVLKSYERFNHLESYSLNRDTLIITVSDTSSVDQMRESKKLKLP